jgi:DivIVA domain-containing protein
VCEIWGVGSLPVPAFTIVLRGYDRAQVDRYVAEAHRRIEELEQALATRDDT